jgi:hypothetical protein
MLVLCADCERRPHMLGHILCLACFRDAGGYFSFGNA